MRATALTSATPDARSLQNRTGSDGTAPDDGFDSALANIAQTGADAAVTPTGGPAVSVAPTPALLDAGQGLAALLAKLAGGTTSGSTDGLVAAATATKGDAGSSDASASAKADKSGDDPDVASQIVTDPLVAMTALLPGLVAQPAAIVAATPAKTTSDAAKLSLALGGAPVGKVSDAPAPGDAASAGASTIDESGVGFQVVASTTHLAPVSPASLSPVAAQTLPQIAEPAAKDSSTSGASLAKSPAAAPADATATDAASRDAAQTTAVASHVEPRASLPDGTLQSLANSVTTFAADVASASSDAQAATSSSAATVATDPAATSVAPARSLTLQLTPGDLGSVTVRLHMTANGLDVDLAVDDRKTLASISHARDELASAIGDNGYRVDSLTIRGSDASSTSTAGSHDSARGQSEAGQGFSGGGGSSGDDNSASRQRASRPSAPAGDPSGDRGGDGVFV